VAVPIPSRVGAFSMEVDEDVGKNEGGINLQVSYSTIIKVFRRRLVDWLEETGDPEQLEDDLEDRELDSLLLQVRVHTFRPYVDRAVPGTASFTGHVSSIAHRTSCPFSAGGGRFWIYCEATTMFPSDVLLH
jgi:hypothetical protein